MTNLLISDVENNELFNLFYNIRLTSGIYKVRLRVPLGWWGRQHFLNERKLIMINKRDLQEIIESERTPTTPIFTKPTRQEWNESGWKQDGMDYTTYCIEAEEAFNENGAN